MVADLKTIKAVNRRRQAEYDSMREARIREVRRAVKSGFMTLPASCLKIPASIITEIQEDIVEEIIKLDESK